MLTQGRSLKRSQIQIGSLVLRTAIGLAGATTLLACGSQQGTDAVGTTSSPLAIAGLFATGVDGANAPIASGASDAHYTLVSTDPAHLGPVAPVAVAPVGGWTGNTATSNWISAQTDTQGSSGGIYTYTTQFSLSGVDTTKASLTGVWACDDKCTLSLNGSLVATSPSPNYGSTSNFSVAAGSPFVNGTNTLTFVVTNSGGGPTGLQVVSLSGSAGCTADSQCTTAQYCDTQAGACTTKLANKTKIPTISGHTPTLDGMCSSATVGTSVCASGFCSASDSECGLGNGEGTCTSGADCQSTACSTNGKCEPAGGCNVDADCNTATQFCTISSNTCTAKIANSQPLPSDSGHTSPTLNGMCTSAAVGLLVCASGACDGTACGIADGDPGCTVATAAVCRSLACSLLGTCEPSGGCNEDADCPANQWCNEMGHACEPKLANLSPIPSDPPHTNPTLDGSCTTGAATLVCQSGLCDTTLKTCVECTAADTSRCSGLDILCGPTGLCIASTDAGADAGTADAGADSGSNPADAGADGAADAEAADTGADGAADAGEAADAADGSASGDGGDAGQSADATTADASNGSSSGGSSSGGSSSGAASSSGGSGAGDSGETAISGELEGGGISCSMSRPRSQESSGGPLLMFAIALGAAFGRGRRHRR